MNAPKKQAEKSSIADLAILGGSPAFTELLHVGRPNIGDRSRLMARINDLLDRRCLTNNGVYVQEFEKKVAAIAETRHCNAVCNATVGLEITIRALGLQGEVIVPAFTFVATVHALHWQGITPVFCDVDPQTHMLDPARVEELITPQTSGILGVHLWGQVCDTDFLEDIARRHGLKLLFDAAHAFGCGQASHPVGGFGDAEVFSFHATKFLNSFEGGAIVTNDDGLAAKIHLMKNFGFTSYDEVGCLGTNGKMSEPSAAMGLTSLESMNEFITVNRRNYECYQKELSGVPGIKLLNIENHTAISNYQYVVIEIEAEKNGLSHGMLLKVLQAENIFARRYFYPGCHRMDPYRSLYPDARARLRNTEILSERVIVLPTGTSVEPKDIEVICKVIRFAIMNSVDLMS